MNAILTPVGTFLLQVPLDTIEDLKDYQRLQKRVLSADVNNLYNGH